jgi:hypothetical protein
MSRVRWYVYVKNGKALTRLLDEQNKQYSTHEHVAYFPANKQPFMLTFGIIIVTKIINMEVQEE